MTKHYVYRMHHDVGFAPHIVSGVSILCGCKTTTVERWAGPGSWIVGIGGRQTGKSDKLIYAMRVDGVRSYGEMLRDAAIHVKHLAQFRPPKSRRVLISKCFYYLGDSAIDLPRNLRHLAIAAQGCKLISDEEIDRLVAHLQQRFSHGVHGQPNKAPEKPRTMRARRKPHCVPRSC